MSNTSRYNTGFSLIESIFILALIALVGALGWVFYNSMMSQEQPDTYTSQTTGDNEPSVNNSSDLDRAETYLNETDVDSELDTSEVDSALSQ